MAFSYENNNGPTTKTTTNTPSFPNTTALYPHHITSPHHITFPHHITSHTTSIHHITSHTTSIHHITSHTTSIHHITSHTTSLHPSHMTSLLLQTHIKLPIKTKRRPLGLPRIPLRIKSNILPRISNTLKRINQLTPPIPAVLHNIKLRIG